MKKITNLLDRFKNITPPDFLVKQALVKTLKKSLNIEIKKEEVFFNKKTGVATIKINSIEKTLVFIKKNTIIKEANKILEKDLIKTII